MDKEKWIKQTAKLFEDVAKIKPNDAMEYGKSLFEANEEDILDGDYSPMDAFTDEMEEWQACADITLLPR